MSVRVADELLGRNTLQGLTPSQVRLLVDELLADYASCLDEGEIDRWPDFFTGDCTYKLIPRENYERNLPIATILCESRGYLLDRVRAVKETSYYAPHQLRHLISGLKIRSINADMIEAEANYAVFRTLADEETKVLNVGRYLDRIVAEDGVLKFAEKLCVYDSVLVPNSLVYPV